MNETEVRLQMYESIRSPRHEVRIVLANQYRLLWLALEVEGGSYGPRIDKSTNLNAPGRGYHSMLHLQLWGTFRAALRIGSIRELRENRLSCQS